MDHLFSRRSLLRGGVRLGATALAYRLGLMSALAQTQTGDYKALVCIFLNGGNDALNMIAPYEAGAYQTYYNARPNVALLRTNDGSGRATMLPFASAPGLPLNYGFHPNFSDAVVPTTGGATATLPGLNALYNVGKMAAVCNIGTLLRPFASKTDYKNSPNERPRSLFDHNIQTDTWQDMGMESGWGNGVGRILAQRAGFSTPQPLVPILLNVAGGGSLYLTGSEPYISLPPGSQNGKLKLSGFSGSATDQARLKALRDIYKIAHPDPVVQVLSDRTDRAIDDGNAASDALVNAANLLTTPFPTSNFGNQMKQIAAIIAARDGLSQNKRQIFFASLGGFDTHDNQLNTHPNLMRTLSDGLAALHASLAAQGLSDNVTSFTLSEFGRTIQNADAGTDHAWGSHALVVGGAVNGGKLYGTYPSLILGGADDVDTGNNARGRLLPTTSVDQYAATLCKWFGISTSEMATFLPNLSRFAPTDLGFMR